MDGHGPSGAVFSLNSFGPSEEEVDDSIDGEDDNDGDDTCPFDDRWKKQVEVDDVEIIEERTVAMGDEPDEKEDEMQDR
jgi:hypothetical protein